MNDDGNKNNVEIPKVVNDDHKDKRRLEDIIKAAKKKIGLSPVNTEHYESIEDFNCDECKEGRIEEEKDYLEIELKLKTDEIKIVDAEIAPT